MISPAFTLKDNECIMLISLKPLNASERYKKIEGVLLSANYKIVETFNPCILAKVDLDFLLSSELEITALLQVEDCISIIFKTDTGLGLKTLSIRPDSDKEIQATSDLWRIPWM